VIGYSTEAAGIVHPFQKCLEIFFPKNKITFAKASDPAYSKRITMFVLTAQGYRLPKGW
jgi:hypothetical protein